MRWPLMDRRLSNDENALVVEAKARAQKSISDFHKLRELTENLGMFHYWAGAFVIFFNEPRMVLKSRAPRASVEWFTAMGKGEPSGV
jgi:hypothetical protein